MDELFLDHGHVLQRNFHAQVAARNHDAVGHAENFIDVVHALMVFNLGDQERVLARLAAQKLADLQNIGRAAREGRGDEIHMVADAKADIVDIVLA